MKRLLSALIAGAGIGVGCTYTPPPVVPPLPVVRYVTFEVRGPRGGVPINLTGRLERYDGKPMGDCLIPAAATVRCPLPDDLDYTATFTGVFTADGYQDSRQHVALNGTPRLTVTPLVPVVTVKPLPPRPSRDAVIGVNLNWQGLTVAGKPWFDLDLAYLPTREARAEGYAAKHQPRPGAPNGDTHLMLAIDMTGLARLPHLKALAREWITEEGGTGIQLMMAGDGNEAGRENHDPGALNFPWLMANFQAIYDFWRSGPDGEDLAQFTVFVPGFDGVVPGWQPPSRVNEFARMARRVIDAGGSGYLGIELAAGYAVWTGEENDWATEDGKRFDVIIQEFPIDVHPEYGPPAEWLNPDRTWRADISNEQRNPWTQVYQMVGRMVWPFHRPAYFPADDQGAPYHLRGGTPRGPFAYICGEIDTYRWVRVRNISLEEINAHRNALLHMGCAWVG
jgi:hypothetical protein